MAKILLVEDDKSLREIYGVRLMAEGYEIVSAGDGEEALAMAIKERPDLIVSDVMMPKISGFDMLDILRSTSETKDVKVIMMTALSSDDQRARGEALGADRYLVKSQVGIEDVVRTVHDVLGDSIANPAPAAPSFPPVATPVDAAPAPAPAPEAAPAFPPVAPAPEPLNTPDLAAEAVSELPAIPTFDEQAVTPAPAPEAAPAPVEQPLVPEIPAAPVAPPDPLADPLAGIAIPPTEDVAPVAPVASAPMEAPQPAPEAVQQNTFSAEPVAAAPAYDIPAPAPEAAPAPQEAPEAIPAPAPVPEAPVTPQPVAPIAPAPPVAPAAPANPTLTELPQNPDASALPQPTAPFSSPAPASLGERVIEPLTAPTEPAPVGDIASQMAQALNETMQPAAPAQAAPQVEAPQPTPPAQNLPPTPPVA